HDRPLPYTQKGFIFYYNDAYALQILKFKNSHIFLTYTKVYQEKMRAVNKLPAVDAVFLRAADPPTWREPFAFALLLIVS
ncbi:MAG: hypothetical protein ACWGN7_02290, partial [Thermodesulfovibrionales bacterium]